MAAAGRKLQGRRAPWVYPEPAGPVIPTPLIELDGNDLSEGTQGKWPAAHGIEFANNDNETTSFLVGATLTGTGAGRAMRIGSGVGASIMQYTPATQQHAIWRPLQERTLAWVVRFASNPPGGWGQTVITDALGPGLYNLVCCGDWTLYGGQFGIGTGNVASAKDHLFDTISLGAELTGMLVLQVRPDGLGGEECRLRWRGTWSNWRAVTWGNSWAADYDRWVMHGGPTYQTIYYRKHWAWDSLVEDWALDMLASGLGVA